MTIQEYQVKLVSLRARRNDITAKVAKENRSALTPEETAQYEILVKDVKDTSDLIDKLTAEQNEQRSAAGVNATVVNPDGIDPTNPLDVPNRDLSRYSLHRALRCICDRKPLDGLEGELSTEIAKRSGKTPAGFYMYTGVQHHSEHRGAVSRSRRERRDLDTTTGTGGINQTVLYQSFIDILRHKTLIDKVGARFMSGLVGKFFIPRQSGKSTMYWLGEAGAPTASNQTLDQVQLSPTTAGAFTDVSRRFIEQTSLDAEAFTRDDLAKVMAVGIDYAAFSGDGLSSSPTGVLFTSGIAQSAHATPDGVLTWGDAVGMETKVAASDADFGNLAYVTNPKVRGLLKTTLRSSVAGAKYIWDDDNEINGYPAWASNNIPSDIGSANTEHDGNLSAILFGNWSDLIVAMWGGLDITVDPYTHSTTGAVRLVALQDVDIKVRHPESFTFIPDVLA